LTPTARQLAGVSADQIAPLGIVGSRARCIAALVQAVNERKVVLACAADVDAQIDALMHLPGIGPWTAQYIAMRALHWPDAFPGTDLMLLRAAKVNHKQLRARAQAWRPWRAYATHYLWQSLGVNP
jgi:AraC family transcriptional regulator of adaptative response / DNA-3-methyladenine glycosylase II